MYTLEAVESVQETGNFGGMSVDSLEEFLHAGVWALFELTKHQSISIRIWKVPVSIKIEKIRPLLVRWLGEQ